MSGYIVVHFFPGQEGKQSKGTTRAAFKRNSNSLQTATAAQVTAFGRDFTPTRSMTGDRKQSIGVQYV